MDNRDMEKRLALIEKIINFSDEELDEFVKKLQVALAEMQASA